MHVITFTKQLTLRWKQTSHGTFPQNKVTTINPIHTPICANKLKHSHTLNGIGIIIPSFPCHLKCVMIFISFICFLISPLPEPSLHLSNSWVGFPLESSFYTCVTYLVEPFPLLVPRLEFCKTSKAKINSVST